MVHREVEPDGAAVAPAHDVHLLHAEVVEQRDHVLGHRVIGERVVAAGRASLAAAVGNDQPVLALERLDLVLELLPVAGAAVQEEQRRAGAAEFVVGPQTASLEVRGHRAGGGSARGG